MDGRGVGQKKQGRWKDSVPRKKILMGRTFMMRKMIQVCSVESR